MRQQPPVYMTGIYMYVMDFTISPRAFSFPVSPVQQLCQGHVASVDELLRLDAVIRPRET